MGRAPAIAEFWDCSVGQELSEYNGSAVSLTELGELCAERSARLAKGRFALSIDETPADFHPLAISKPMRWEHAVTCAVFAIAGQVPSRNEIVHGREVLDRLTKSHRRTLEPGEVLGVLAPLLVGFRLARGPDFVNEANRHCDLAAVFDRLLTERPITVDIPLCAHREAESFVKRRLAPAPDSLAVRRVCGLVRMLMINSRTPASTVHFLQQGASERASACMVPNMFLEYLYGGDIDDLLNTLERHTMILRALLKQFSSDTFQLRVSPLDLVSGETEYDLVDAFGTNWQHADQQLYDTQPWGREDVRRLLGVSALKHVARVMPEVGSINQAQASGTRVISDRGNAAIEWFLGRTRMTVHGRALYEIAFYRRCAMRAKERDAIGLGFDRDWSLFQRYAWHLAFERPIQDPVPLAYARWTRSPRRDGSLRHLNFRQFWLPDESAR